jgi:hypothetical protein
VRVEKKGVKKKEQGEKGTDGAGKGVESEES